MSPIITFDNNNNFNLNVNSIFKESINNTTTCDNNYLFTLGNKENYDKDNNLNESNMPNNYDLYNLLGLKNNFKINLDVKWVLSLNNRYSLRLPLKKNMLFVLRLTNKDVNYNENMSSEDFEYIYKYLIDNKKYSFFTNKYVVYKNVNNNFVDIEIIFNSSELLNEHVYYNIDNNIININIENKVPNNFDYNNNFKLYHYYLEFYSLINQEFKQNSIFLSKNNYIKIPVLIPIEYPILLISNIITFSNSNIFSTAYNTKRNLLNEIITYKFKINTLFNSEDKSLIIPVTSNSINEVKLSIKLYYKEVINNISSNLNKKYNIFDLETDNISIKNNKTELIIITINKENLNNIVNINNNNNNKTSLKFAIRINIIETNIYYCILFESI